MVRIIELGPGPPRRGFITEDRDEMPRMSLKAYAPVQTLALSHSRSVIGWIALDGELSS